jgi:hypothetical protein
MQQRAISSGIDLALVPEDILDPKGKYMASPPWPVTDPVKIDSKHHKVEFENEKVRVLRISFGPK